MTQDSLNQELINACNEWNWNKAKELVFAGANPNLENEYGNSIFDDSFFLIYQDALEDDLGESVIETAETIKNLVTLLVEHGWNIKKYGPTILSGFGCCYTFDCHTYDVFRFFMQYDFDYNENSYEKILDSVGTEESYQRCCVYDHKAENVLYAIYECVKAKKEGKRYDSIHPYFSAVGKQIDRIIYLNDIDSTSQNPNFTEFNHDIGFVLGNELLVLREGVNILFMDDLIVEQPQLDMPELFGDRVIGSKIKSITFDHKDFLRRNTSYGQPTIIIELNNGKKLKFSHNFGELPNNDYQSRFWVEE